ncbi:MAG: hypothetical protein Q9174_003484, partial [Haloplaca sp. 1 TL-2023]
MALQPFVPRPNSLERPGWWDRKVVHDAEASEHCSFRRQWAEILEQVRAVDTFKYISIASGQPANIGVLVQRASNTQLLAGYVATGVHAAAAGQIPKNVIFKLPPEMLRTAVNEMDLNSIEDFASTHPQAKMAVKRNLYYERLRKHAYSTFAALSREGNTCKWSLEQIYGVLTQDWVCVGCGGFGGFLFLPSLERVCQGCAQSEVRFSPINSHVARYKCGLTPAQIKSITMWKAKYYYSSDRPTAANILISRDAALRAGGQPAPNPVVSSTMVSRYRRLAIVACPFLDKQTLAVEHGLA